MIKSAGAMNSELMNDADAAPQACAMRMHWSFVSKVIAELRKRGEIAST